MQALSLVDSRPNCLIIDEIDGAPTVRPIHHKPTIHTYQHYYMYTSNLYILTVMLYILTVMVTLKKEVSYT